jgi:uncharacterized 2Fe-2S/4Fe-4S cluster protein (DUF4445 family)
MTTNYHIDFQPIGRRGECNAGDSLLDCSRQLGAGISSICGGKGKCQSCKVRVLKGSVSEPTANEEAVFTQEEIDQGWRLACQAYAKDDCRIEIPPDSMTAPQRIQVEGLEVDIEPSPAACAYWVSLSPPSLEDLKADADRLLQALQLQHGVACDRIDGDVLIGLSPSLRSWGWECQAAVRGHEVTAVSPWPSPHLGLAVDLGSTKVAGYLLDLRNGKALASKGVMNPQISYGEDIISRIDTAIRSPEERTKLQTLAAEAIDQLADDLCAEAKAKAEHILEAVIVGNTAMHHLFLGLPVRHLALSPYVPAVSMALDFKARDLKLHFAAGAYVHMLPNIAGFVGGDHVAVLLTVKTAGIQGLTLALDIGTNTEVSLIDGDRVSSVSCASGPAFEGYQIKCGMRAGKGAIERVRIQEGKIQYQTIDDAPPVGICGSGVLDAMAQMYSAGIINRGGRILDNHPRIRELDNHREFILIGEEELDGRPAIVITQQDIRHLQVAKAAIRAGIQVLLESHDRCEKDIENVIIAGAFGSYIDVSSAMAIGMLPSLPLRRFRQVGNAAGMGAKLALVSKAIRMDARKLASKVCYVELAGAHRFSDAFVQACYLGDYQGVGSQCDL